ncbi:MAG TPA: GDP-mannose 4,6-dehydratase [Solirubrobacteraceae bacterium]|nr:GDP-mannose 4,6-dehydratase [Solirubrobacteraceae bacterium]
MGPSLVTGISGQDGSYLAERLVAEGREVVGMMRPPLDRPLPWVPAEVRRVAADLLDPVAVRRAVVSVAPSEVFHLAAPAFVPESWRSPAAALAAIGAGTAAVLEGAREVGARVLVAGSAQVFGASPVSPQDEDTPLRPDSPYGVGKAAAQELVRVLRGDGLFACTAIAYNHESPRRPERYVTRKLTRAAAAVSLGLEQEVAIGNLDARRDWLHARDVVEGMVLALRHPSPGDYVLAGGVARTVREFAAAAFAVVGLSAEPYLRVDPELVRAEEGVLVGDASRARAVLGWAPRVSFEELVREMVEADLAALRGR